MIRQNNTWIRIAGNAANIKAGNKHGWRVFLSTVTIEKSALEIKLLDWSLEGQATLENFIPGVNSGVLSARGVASGVIAWIDMYGDVVVENEKLHITLRDPV